MLTLSKGKRMSFAESEVLGLKNPIGYKMCTFVLTACTFALVLASSNALSIGAEMT